MRWKAKLPWLILLAFLVLLAWYSLADVPIPWVM